MKGKSHSISVGIPADASTSVVGISDVAGL
jgi:hypothetical protein